MNNSYQQQLREIDIKDILWKLLAQWKAVLLVSLFIALLVSGLKYAKDTKAYNSEVTDRNEAAEQAKIEPEKRVAEVMESLSDEDAEAIEMVMREQSWIDDQKAYLDESIKMSVDPASKRLLELTYDIEGEDSKDISVLFQKYYMFISSDSYTGALGAVIDPNADKKYIGELIKAEGKTSPDVDTGQTGAVLSVSVILPEDTDAEEVVRVSDSVISEFSKKIGSIYRHSLDAAGFDVLHEYDYDLVSRHYDTISRINGMQAAVINAENALTPEQMAAYEIINEIRNESAELTNAKDAVSSTASDDEIVAPKLSKKYFLIGFILGAFIYAGIYLLMLIIKGGINSAVSAEKYTRVRLLGETYYDDMQNGFYKLFHSKTVEKAHYKDKTNEALQTERMAESLDAVCEHAGTKEVSILDMTVKDSKGKASGLVGLFIDSISSKGVNAECFEAANDFNEKTLLDLKNAVIAVSADTKAAALGRIMSLCHDYDVNILGSVFISET